MLKGPSALVRNVSSVNIRREFLNAFVRFFDICAKFRSRRQGRIAEPAVGDDPLLTGISDRARFGPPPGGEGFLDSGPHPLKEISRICHTPTFDPIIETGRASE